MTPLDTNSILRILRLAEKATEGPWHILLGDKSYVGRPGIVKPIACGSQKDAAHIANCDPTTISALCRLALEGVAMKQAMRERGGEGITQRVHELLAAIENGETL